MSRRGPEAALRDYFFRTNFRAAPECVFMCEYFGFPMTSMTSSSKNETRNHSPRKITANPAQISTGIRGLDEVLLGGLPGHHLYLITGDPGTGKTTLAMQFLLEGVRRGEPCLYITLSESRRELEGMAKSHHWPADKLPIVEMLPTLNDLSPEAQYTVFHPSDVELADTAAAILNKVDEMKPVRLVIDSLSELRMLARDSLRYRRQILALKRHLVQSECSALLLDDRTTSGNDLQLHSIAHGVIILESLERDFGIKRRRMEVRKMRGCMYREGFHDFKIETGGVAVYPRLVASEHRPSLAERPVPSGLPELDALFDGGIDSGTSTLLMGPAGCGKSTIAVRYAVTAAERGESSAIFFFDETQTTLMKRSKSLGMDLEPYLQSGLVTLKQIDPAEMSAGEFVAQVRYSVEERGASIVVLDSLNGFINAMPGEQFLLLQLHELLSYLNQNGVTTLFTMAQSGFVGANMENPVDVSYLADTVLLFRYFESGGRMRQALSVMKKRSGAHERTIRELAFPSGRLKVGAALEQFEGILTGVPKFVGMPAELQSSDPAHQNGY